MNEIDPIVRQYTTVVGALDKMFSELDKRSHGALWKKEGSLKGVGSCASILTYYTEKGLVGPASNKLLELRDLKSKNVPGIKSLKTGCDFHRQNMGCSLGELKSPFCISHIDDSWELGIVFGINGFSLEHDIKWSLASILSAKDPFTNAQLASALDNDRFVEEVSGAISLMTAHIKRFPII